MKYTCEIVIDQPREKVVALFDNQNNMKYWQKGLVSFEPISGDPGKPGAKSRLKYEMGKRKVEMVETIVRHNPPEEIHNTYETKGIINEQRNYFKEEGDKTRWVSESTFHCSGLMKVMAFFWGEKAFKKQSEVYMGDFKSFAEGNPKYGQ